MSHSRIITITSIIVWTAVIASTLYAQALTISSTIENLTIQVRKIFVSDDAKKMYDSSIIFDGSNGNIKTASLTLSDDQYSCPDRSGTGCALAVNRDGSVVRKDVTLQWSTTTTTTDPSDSEDYFVSKWWSADRLNRTANEIVFADPSLVSDTDQARLRINIKDVVNTNTTVAGANKMLDVGGAINSRTSLEVSSPLDRADQTAYNLQGKARGDLIITKHVQHPMPPAATIKVWYNNGTAYTRQDLIVSPLGNTTARLGINTPTYPTATLDVNGEMRSQETLTIWYLNSGNIVTNIRQAVGILISSPSATEQTAIRSQSCGDSPIPSSLQCSNGSCSSLLLSGSEIWSSICYDRVGTSTTMQRAQMYQVMSLYSSTTLIAKTDTQQVGINTLVPQSTLDVNGDTYLDGSGYIFGIPASTSNGKTSIQMKEINNTESTTYTWWNTNCKWLSVDEAGHIILVQLPKTMCGATGSIVTPPTLATNGACGSAHNTTGTSAPTSNLCSAGTASSVAGSGPWTWSCAGSNGGTSASCQMNKQWILTRIYNCDNKPDHTIWNTVSNYTQTSNNGWATWTPISSITTFWWPSSTWCNFICDDYYDRDGANCVFDATQCIEILDPGWCFVKDTFVTLADGSTKKIQDVIVGDILKWVSTDNMVVSLLRPILGNKLLYSINGSDAFVTPNHPFLTTEWWKSPDPEATRREIPDLDVTLLQIGDILITASGTRVITTLTPHTDATSTQLYNFQLDGDHTYFANGFAVHNKLDIGQCPYVNDGEGNYGPSPSCQWYSYNAPTQDHPQRKLYPNLFGAGYSCTSSHSINNWQNSCASYGMKCDRDAHICWADVIPISNICEAYCENNPNYTGPIGTPACNGLNAAMCNNNTPRCQWTDPTLL